ncbi:YggS family pyridoxal phosphate-dependent enzyme [Flavisolibacter nicotianae]|uniref:YggS family pyridoxal phosphate-dependent enzyme n=1 Tax=Flavisolibacter nicotianae TaxID=2364882 RepID=UPI000EB48253|nr:YggS family pyridoxal phosphate-dependent enzyme [Flavisolibacter nicotianae]
MYISTENYTRICEEVGKRNAQLVAVSKTKPVEAIQELYGLGHRDFGENYVQELVEKQARLPQDIRWHFIGHLQTNKVKYIAPFVHLVHGIDSLKLLKEVNKQGQKFNRTIPVLLQVHIAREETKFGFDERELEQVLSNEPALQQMANIQISGLMGMASFSDDTALVRQEFKNLKRIFDRCHQTGVAHTDFRILSMGMSGDYHIALEEGSTMVRIGSLLFGSR